MVYAKHQADQSIYDDDKKVIELAKEMGLKSGQKFIVANKIDFRTLRVK